MKSKYDFSGWATRFDIKCADGRTIRHGAFDDNEGAVVPVVWNHEHNDPSLVLGHALLKNEKGGVRAYVSLNDTPNGQNAKEFVKHGDVVALSIYANQLRQQGGDVIHGNIRELSLVLAGANPGAYIDTIIEHSDDMDEIANIAFIDDEGIVIEHSEELDAIELIFKNDLSHAAIPTDQGTEEPKKEEKETKEMAEEEKTVQDVIDSMTEEQQKVMYALIGQAIEDSKNNDEGDGKEVKHNVFENDEMNNDDVLKHSEMMEIMADGKRFGSLKEAALQHGITDINILFPDDKNVTNGAPELIKRDQGWVSVVMDGVHHTPFSRIKSVFANITEDDARALGYLPDRTHRDAKGNLVDANGNRVMKKEEVFSLLKRATSPATIYKKQRIDRDDIIDITDFDVVSWIKAEMRMMLNEEIARAILIGDGRLSSSDDKINESNIRPIWTDAPLYTINAPISTSSSTSAALKAKAVIKAAIKSRKNYKGSGNPIAFMSEDVLTDILLLEDLNGRIIYDSVEKVATAMRVSRIVTGPQFDNLTRTNTDSQTCTLAAIIVNLNDYNVGADKGGAVNLFDNFDIDYNAMKYLIETRCSGALIKPYSAIAIEFVLDGDEPDVTLPSVETNEQG